MIGSFFRRNREAAQRRRANRQLVDSVFEQIVAAARHRHLYAVWSMPDTPLGRYESLGLHMALFLRRTRAKGAHLEALSQDVVDQFFTDLDHSIRELGIGDASVPKRMRKLGRMFYGRMGAYWQAIDSDSQEELATALRRNIEPEGQGKPVIDAASIARYMIDSAQVLDAQADEALLAGRIAFANPEVI